MLDFDQDSPQAKAPSHPTPPSAGKLIAGDSVHVGDHGGYPRVRLDHLSTPMCSDSQGMPPFTDEPRRNSAPVRLEEKEHTWTGQT